MQYDVMHYEQVNCTCALFRNKGVSCAICESNLVHNFFYYFLIPLVLVQLAHQSSRWKLSQISDNLGSRRMKEILMISVIRDSVVLRKFDFDYFDICS